MLPMPFLATTAPRSPGRTSLVRGRALLGEHSARASRANSSAVLRSSKVAVAEGARKTTVANAEFVESQSPNIPITDGALRSSSKGSSRRDLGKDKEVLSKLLLKVLVSCST